MRAIRPDAVTADYRLALQRFLHHDGDEEALHQAYEFGRRAIAERMGLLDVLVLHQEVLAAILAEQPEYRSSAHDVQSFLLECLSPFEIVHRGAVEANAALHRINETLENEAKRIAHALHDEAGQLLVTVHLALERLAREAPATLHEPLAEVRSRLNDVEAQLRQLSHELRPTVLDHLGLLMALRSLAEGFSARAGIPVVVEGSGKFPHAIEMPLYRIVQEALRNVARHANATRVEVRLGIEDGRVRCSIADDGGGFAAPAGPASTGLGLIGMRERLRPLGGTLDIRSAPGRGTVLAIVIPLEGHEACRSES